MQYKKRVQELYTVEIYKIMWVGSVYLISAKTTRKQRLHFLNGPQQRITVIANRTMTAQIKQKTLETFESYTLIPISIE